LVFDHSKNCSPPGGDYFVVFLNSIMVLITGITSCAFAAVTESMLPQTVSSLLASIRRESSGGKRIDSLYTLLGKDGKEKQTGDKEELRQQLQWAVKRSEERKRRRRVLRDEVDSTVEVLKEAKKPPKASGESRRGFG
jgi:cobalamin biosynthesis protein CobD/CbiB